MRVSGSVVDVELHQWANDWLSTNPAANPHEPCEKSGALKPGIVSPIRAIFNTEECARLQESRDQACEAWAENQTPSTGFFWKRWALRTLTTTRGATIGFMVDLGRPTTPAEAGVQ